MTADNQMTAVDGIVAETNALAIQDGVKAALLADLQPIAGRLEEYQQTAATCRVEDEQDAAGYALTLAEIDADIKAVEKSEVLGKIVAGLHGMHRKWTALRGLFTDQLNDSKKTIRAAIVTWQEAQRKAAEELQRKLQAEADEKARKDRERLEAQAAKYKTEEKREAKMAEAAAVHVPTVTVAAPKVLGVRKVWKVTGVDMAALCTAVAGNPSLAGYLEAKLTAMERTKAANPAVEIPGVTFEHVVK